MIDPFLLLDHFFVKPPAGFPDHPHRFVFVSLFSFSFIFIFVHLNLD